MDWFRAHHGISNDIKLSLISAKLNVPRCEVGWVWMILLDHASQNTEDRGNIGSIQADEISMLAGVTGVTVTNIMAAFIDRKMLTAEGRLTSWEKRQPDHDPTNAERQRRYRDKAKSVPLVTPHNALCNTEENRTEQNREEKTHTQQRVRQMPQTPKAIDFNGQTSQRFEEWWTVWSSVRGTADRVSAAQAYLSVVSVEAEAAAFACVRSYIGSGLEPGHGFKPSNFLFVQAKDKFSARWPPARDSPRFARQSTQEAMLDRAAELLRQEELRGEIR